MTFLKVPFPFLHPSVFLLFLLFYDLLKGPGVCSALAAVIFFPNVFFQVEFDVDETF